jgi:Arc/MetJ-type ribon-helix-helix transcriptional regulator
MGTISVPLSKELEAQLDHLVASGVASNRAAVMRRALEKLADDAVVEAILLSQQEAREGKLIAWSPKTLKK